ncbi:hypothetical protein LTS10_005272 [Elasticomyces elasticus]|nr:hypothetical protein LTS10_005272 [Elasticomyces elasticus]
MSFPRGDGCGYVRGGCGGSAGTKRPATEEANNDNTTKRSKKRTFFGLPANLPKRNGSSESPVSSGSLEACWLELDQEMEQVVDSTLAAVKPMSFSDYRNRAKEKAAVPPTPAQPEQSQPANTEAAQIVASGTTSPITSPEKTTAPRNLTHLAPARPFNHDTNQAGPDKQSKTPITPRTTPGLWQPSASASTKMARPQSRDWTSVHVTPTRAVPVEPTVEVASALTDVPADKDVPPKYWGEHTEPKDFRDKQFFALMEYELKTGLETSMSFAEFGVPKVQLELERSKENAAA